MPTAMNIMNIVMALFLFGVCIVIARKRLPRNRRGWKIRMIVLFAAGGLALLLQGISGLLGLGLFFEAL